VLTAKGALGSLSLAVSGEVTATIADGSVTIAPKDESQRARRCGARRGPRQQM